MSSTAQLLANQANSQLSTGPRTDAGKSASSLNNFHHGARSEAVLLPGEDPAEYEALLADLTTHFTASDATELRCVREMADADWRLRRIRRCSSDALTRRIAELAAEYPDAEPTQLHSRAIETLGPATGTSYATWLRYESKFERQYNRAYQDWLHYQTNRRRVSDKQADIWMRQAIFQPVSAEPPAANPQHPAASLTELASSVQTPRNAPCPCGSGDKFKRCCGKTAPPVLGKAA